MVKATCLVHGATNYKGDSPTFAVSRATPVVSARIVKRLTADGDILFWDMPKYRSTYRGRRDGLMRDDTFNRIQSIIAGHLEIAPTKVILPTSFIDGLHVDSFDMIELIMAFEHAFDVLIPDIAVGTIVTVQDAVDYIKQQQKKPRRSDLPGL
jgi:acyl carrier protein